MKKSSARKTLNRIKMRTLTIFILVLLPFTARCQCNNIDIIVVGDYSGSVHKNERYVMDAFASFAAMASEESNIRVGLILFNENPEVVVSLCKDQQLLYSSSVELRKRNASGSTDIESAIQLAANTLYTEQNNSRKLIILISDGDITEGGSDEQAIYTARQLSVLGVGICSVLIKDASSRPELMKELSNGCYVESSYENLTAQLKELDLCL